MRRFEMILPGSVKDVVQALGQHDGAAKLVAGGTDLLPQLKNHLLKPGVVVDLSGVAALRELTQEGGGLRIGAAVTARELERDARLQKPAYRGIAESGALIGSVQVRHLATVGGNICNAAPSADMIPPLLALDAQALIAGSRGERTVPLRDFITGVRKTVLAPDELLVALTIPDPGAQSGGAYLRHTPRRELDIAVVGVGSQVTLAGGVCKKARIALAAVAPTPVHATAAERALEGQTLTAQKIEEAATLAVEAARPISDQRGSAEFRRHLVRVLTRRTLTTALARANGAQA
ncbi:MAG TPA: xanthine dehydrogenase family protein subunit M [Methylomirabilota bacterium]|jgi:carbon-monoxide dehydrogenase medium subunit|nr:xanthine dehydrogenase family protein subunit M [Methylomirabilota bacterium]